MIRAFFLVAVTVSSAGAAQASSLTVLPSTPDATPSVVHVGSTGAEPVAETLAEDTDAMITVSRSIVAFGADAAASRHEAIASVEEQRRPARMPMVMRGGIFGEAFRTPPAPAPEVEATPEAGEDGAPYEVWKPRPMPEPQRR